MNRVLHWGLLSTARINEALIPALRKSPRNEILGVGSRDLERARAYAKEWSIPRVYGSYEELLADPDIDVIYNPLPNALHAEWTVKAAQAGKHVLVEKPLDVTLEAVDAVIEAAQKNKVVVAEAFMYRHHPLTVQLQDLVVSGTLGQIRYVYGAFTFNLQRPHDVRWDPALGGGSIWDVGCYPISYTRALLQAEPVEVFGWQTTSASGVDETFTGQMWFPGDIQTQFLCSFHLPLHTYMEARGDQGSLRLTLPFKLPADADYTIQMADEVTVRPAPVADLYLGEVEDISAAILEGKTPRVTLEDSRNNIKTILALLESARTGKPVRLS